MRKQFQNPPFSVLFASAAGAEDRNLSASSSGDEDRLFRSVNDSHATLIQQALLEAEKAYALGEVPVGAVITNGEEIIARSYNLIESLQDATAHAEILAIKEASKISANWRLSDLTLYVTLEPCVMCMGAIQNSRIKNVVFGAWDKVAGACGSISDLTYDHRAKKKIECIGGILEEECTKILKNFFKEQRVKV